MDTRCLQEDLTGVMVRKSMLSACLDGFGFKLPMKVDLTLNKETVTDLWLSGMLGYELFLLGFYYYYSGGGKSQIDNLYTCMSDIINIVGPLV